MQVVSHKLDRGDIAPNCLHRVFTRGAASRYLEFTIDIDINGVAMEDAQESIRCDTFVILEHEEYRGGRHSQYNPRVVYAFLSIDDNSSEGLYRNVRSQRYVYMQVLFVFFR